ncbi:MAG TPA: TonB-dependent receptor plug domain-containing protein [Candidatus Kapabacteria bacterium]
MKYILSVVAVLFIVATASAQDSVKKVYSKEVIVTGFPAEENITPVPYVTITKEKIERSAEYKDVPSILSNQPSMVFYSQSGLYSGYSFGNIRGFDQRRLSILVNGIPQNDPEDHNVYWIDMPDLASSTTSMTIQRGAGTAFYGPAAIGGSINVVTAPAIVPSYVVSAMYGSYNTAKFAFEINSGLIDNKYAISARLSKFKSDGYRHADKNDLNAYHLSLMKYDSVFSYQFNFYGGQIEDGLDYYGIYPDDEARSNFDDKELRKTNWSESFTYERRPEEGERFFQPHYEFLSTWSLNNNTKFTNSLFYIQGDGQFDYDGTWVRPSTGYSHSYYYRLTPEYAAKYGFTALTDTTLGNELTRGYVGNKQFGWLPRIEYTHENGTLNVGGEVRIHRSLHWGKLLSAAKMPVDLPGDYHYYEYNGGKDVLSAYASEQYHASDDISVTVAAQLVNQKYRFYDEKPFYVDSAFASSSGLLPGFTSHDFTVPLTFLNPRLGINIILSDALTSFGSVSYTTREPRLKDYYNAEFFTEPNFQKTQFGTYDYTQPLIRPESLLDVELGVRLNTSIGGGVLTSSLGGYYMPFTDELIKTGKKDRFGSSIVGNAESTIHMGIEYNGRYAYSTLFEVGLNFTVSKNEIKQFDSYDDPTLPVGKTPIGFPSVMGAIDFHYNITDGIGVGVIGRYVGEMYGDIGNSDYLKNDAFFVADANLSLIEKDLLGLNFVKVTFQINNIANTLYTSYVESSAGFFVGAPMNLYGGLEIGL